jgi:Type III secretion system, cytoplasmic E component of needle
MNLLFPPAVMSNPSESDADDLADRLRGSQGPQLMGQMRQHLDELRARLLADIARGADSMSYEQLQAGLQAVDAATDILKQLPVRSDNFFDSPLIQAPRPTNRSNP